MLSALAAGRNPAAMTQLVGRILRQPYALKTGVAALDELARAHGWRVHRSWWVAADAVEAVRWRRGTGEISLVGGLTAPVSRTLGPVLKAAGWL